MWKFYSFVTASDMQSNCGRELRHEVLILILALPRYMQCFTLNCLTNSSITINLHPGFVLDLFSHFFQTIRQYIKKTNMQVTCDLAKSIRTLSQYLIIVDHNIKAQILTPFATGVVLQMNLKVKFTPEILMKRKQFSLHLDLLPLKSIQTEPGKTQLHSGSSPRYLSRFNISHQWQQA